MKTEPNQPIGVIDGMYGADAMKGGHIGLTKREYFAAMAMQGMIGNIKPTPVNEILSVPKNIADWSVLFADALIESLNNQS